MPDSLLNIGLKQIRKLVPVQNEIQLEDDFFIMDVKYSDNLQFLKYPCRSDAYIAIFCKSGELNVEINLGLTKWSRVRCSSAPRGTS